VTNNQLILAVADRLSEIPRIADLVGSFCAARGIPSAVSYDINLALEELLTNTISYGFDDGPGHVIEVRIRREAADVVVEVIDNARPFDPFKAPVPNLDASIDDRPIGGLGVYLVKTVMDDVQYRRADGRNHVTLRKRLPKAAG
jgi:serine/threonine-protein kinase RsbW